MKAYNLNIGGEDEVIAADTIIQALNYYAKTTGFELNVDFSDEDDIWEVPESEWADHIVTNTDYDESDPEDKPSWTLAELMKGRVEPALISSTVY